MKYELSISNFRDVGGIHFYGYVYRGIGDFEHEMDRPDPEPMPKWWTDEERLEMEKHWRTIRFPSEWAVILAAKEWFESVPEIRLGDMLTVRKEHTTPEERLQLRQWRRERKISKNGGQL